MSNLQGELNPYTLVFPASCFSSSVFAEAAKCTILCSRTLQMKGVGTGDERVADERRASVLARLTTVYTDITLTCTLVFAYNAYLPATVR